MAVLEREQRCSRSKTRWGAAVIRSVGKPQGDSSKLVAVKHESGGGENPPAARTGRPSGGQSPGGDRPVKTLNGEFTRHGLSDGTRPCRRKRRRRRSTRTSVIAPAVLSFPRGRERNPREERQEGSLQVTSLGTRTRGENPEGRTPRALPRRKARKVGGGANRREVAKT